jgi:hypothetical protein
MEQICKAGRNLFCGCSHGSVIDISDAFYHIDMAPESQKYIGFEWLGKFYHYNSLPMGIHSARFIFTEVTNQWFGNGGLKVFWFSNTLMIFQVCSFIFVAMSALPLYGRAHA